MARWWGAPDEGFPWDEADATRLTIEIDGVVAGLVQYWEETEPKYRHAAIDLFLDPVLHGRGWGERVVGRLVRLLIEGRGHHRITIDPAADNAAAIRAYEKVGFREVGRHREAHRRDGRRWDVAYLDCLASEFTSPVLGKIFVPDEPRT